MNQNAIRLCARFKTLFARETGIKIDLVRFMKDEVYAEVNLAVAADTQNEELEILATQLMEYFGLLGTGETDAKAASGKYAGGLR